jgi:glycosyltransferase involved in cell wall biosynthesis
VSTAYLYADLVSELRKLGHEIVVLTSTPHYNIVEEQQQSQPLKKKGWFYYQSVYDGVKVIHIPMSKSRHTLKRIFDFVKFHLLALCSIAFLGKYDIVLSPSPPLTIGVVGYWLARLKGAKAIYNVQEIYPDFAINQGVVKNKFLIKVLKSIEGYIYNKSAAVVTIDDLFSEIIRPRIKDGTKLHVIPNFIDTELYKPASKINSFSQRYNLTERFVVEYAGNIGFAQNWDPVIFAAKALKDWPITFLIIGDGVRKAWLKSQKEMFRLNNLLLLDYQQRELMPQINAVADIHTIVMSAEMDNDGFPSKIYAIMSSARPAIVSTGNKSPLHKVLSAAGYKRIVPLNDNEAYTEAILNAFHERESLPEEGRNGRLFIEKNFSKETVAKQYHDLIEKCLSNPKS